MALLVRNRRLGNGEIEHNCRCSSCLDYPEVLLQNDDGSAICKACLTALINIIDEGYLEDAQNAARERGLI